LPPHDGDRLSGFFYEKSWEMTGVSYGITLVPEHQSTRKGKIKRKEKKKKKEKEKGKKRKKKDMVLICRFTQFTRAKTYALKVP